jgi:hypothetical protein
VAGVKHPARASGVLFGATFVGLGLIEGSHALPLVAPLLGGALAVGLAEAKRRGGVRFGEAVRLGAATGVAGLLFVLVVGVPVVFAIAGPSVQRRLEARGVRSPLDVFLAVAGELAILGVANVLLAVLGSAIAAPFFRARAPRR